MLPCIVLVDGTIYLNPWFLESKRQDVGDYAPITVLAHEWGHHVQALNQHPLHQWQPV